MGEFVVSAVSKSGKIERQNVSAINAEEAIDLCKFEKQKVVKVQKDWLYSIKKLIRFKPKIDNQILLLSSLSAISESGQNLRSVLFSMLKTYKREYEVTDISKFEEIYKLSDILRELNFNDSVITLISAGEKSGDMSAMLDTAAQTLQDQQEMQKRANQGLKGSLIMMTFALILLITLPLTLGDVIAEIINQPDMHIATNSITDFFLFMSYALREYWPIIIMIIIMTMYFRGIIWLKLRPLPLFKQVWELQKINRSINFLSSYRPFTLAGIDSLTTMRILSENAQGETQKVFTKMASDLKSGVSISTAIDNENFVQLLRIGFGSFERTTEKSQIKIITSLERSLVNINEIYSTKISVFLKTLAMIVTAAMVIMLFMGVILPLQSITAS